MMRLLSVGFISIFFVIAGCVLNLRCENVLVRQAKSPDGQLKAVVLSRGCGATTDETIGVSILPANALLPNDEGNVFCADESNVYVKWLSSSNLQITTRGKIEVFKKNTKHDFVTITYK